MGYIADARDSRPTKWVEKKRKQQQNLAVRFAIAISGFLPPCGSITFRNRYVQHHVAGGKHRRAANVSVFPKCCSHELYIWPVANATEPKKKRRETNQNMREKMINEIRMCLVNTVQVRTQAHTSRRSRRLRRDGRHHAPHERWCALYLINGARLRTGSPAIRRVN